jgi:23S rRNA pseudouridine1911/1915/1917 synthase
MVVHPGKLYRDFSACLGISFDNLPMNSSPGLVHRIDKDTSGLLVIAKNCSDDSLAKQFEAKPQKGNMLLWFGKCYEEAGTIEGNLARFERPHANGCFADPEIENLL